VGLLLVDSVIIAPSGIVGLVKDRQAAFATMGQPPVFALLYLLNLLPTYFLIGQGQAAQSIGIVFWGILVFVAYTRGQIIGRPWLVVFPVVGALLAVAPISNATPVLSSLVLWSQDVFGGPIEATTIALAAASVIQLIGILCGLAPGPRLAEEPA
ncbi:MAG TPA: hypothetical protein VGF60_19605, partial [Xanthobacteraceae bacterium]